MEPSETQQVHKEGIIEPVLNSTKHLYLVGGAVTLAILALTAAIVMVLYNQQRDHNIATASQSLASSNTAGTSQEEYDKYINEELGVAFLVEKGTRYINQQVDPLQDMVFYATFYGRDFEEYQEVAISIFDNPQDLDVERWQQQHNLLTSDMYGANKDYILPQYEEVRATRLIDIDGTPSLLVSNTNQGVIKGYYLIRKHGRYIYQISGIGVGSIDIPTEQFMTVASSVVFNPFGNMIDIDSDLKNIIYQFIKNNEQSI